MTIKTVILCGGLGTRIGAETKKIPKPMIKINKKPLIEYIMRKFIYEGEAWPELQTHNINGMRFYEVPNGDKYPSITFI